MCLMSQVMARVVSGGAYLNHWHHQQNPTVLLPSTSFTSFTLNVFPCFPKSPSYLFWPGFLILSSLLRCKGPACQNISIWNPSCVLGIMCDSSPAARGDWTGERPLVVSPCQLACIHSRALPQELVPYITHA